MLQNTGTQLAVVGHLPFTLKFLAREQRSPEAEGKAETPVCAWEKGGS